MQKRSANVRQGGEIGFPGGMFDPITDKNPKDTAVRETIEEMGIARDKIEIIGRTDTVISITGSIVEGFVGFTEIEDLYAKNKSEGSRKGTCSPSFLLRAKRS